MYGYENKLPKPYNFSGRKLTPSTPCMFGKVPSLQFILKSELKRSLLGSVARSELLPSPVVVAERFLS
jgi:hypothetical protein